MSASVKDVLLKAAEEIERRGWKQDGSGGYTDNDPVCAAAACRVSVIALGQPFPDAILTAAKHALSRHLGLDPKVQGIPDWNDAPERTQAEVVAALRAAAEAQP